MRGDSPADDGPGNRDDTMFCQCQGILSNLVTMVFTGDSMQIKLPTMNQTALSAPPGVSAGIMKPGTKCVYDSIHASRI